VAPVTSAFYRVFFGGVFLICACLMQNEFRFQAVHNTFLAIVCGLLFSLDLFFWHLCIQYVGPGLATILGNFQVFVLAAVGFFVFKEKLTMAFLLAVPLAVAGLFLVIGIDTEVVTEKYLYGLLFGLMTALFYSAFLLLLRKVQTRADDALFYYLMVISFASAGFLAVKMLLTGDSFVIPDIKSFMSLIILGVFIQAIAWVVISSAISRIRASLTGLILLLQPALSFIWDVLIFKRPTGPAGWIGVIIVLGAIYMGMTGRQKT
jgi:drug/metabolite transporter (DMT)-like permease